MSNLPKAAGAVVRVMDEAGVMVYSERFHDRIGRDFWNDAWERAIAARLEYPLHAVVVALVYD